MKLSVRTLLDGAVDYAGLFPPAGLDMASSIRNYGRYVSGEDGWALGRFVVPVSRLEEFNFNIGTYVAEGGNGRWRIGGREESWRLSALSDGDLSADMDRIKRFNNWHGERDETLKVTIDAIEAKAGPREVTGALSMPLADSLRVFFEIPIGSDPDGFLPAVARAGAAAKVRTGGAASETVPTAHSLVRFLDACLRHGVRFKATGGLRHPLCRVRESTSVDADRRCMTHGFLNVLLSAAFIYDGMTLEDAVAVATEQSASAFPFDDAGVEWRGHRLASDALSLVRRDFAVAFGSSSFEEPMEGLRRLKLG
jgi:hypothetical protein